MPNFGSMHWMIGCEKNLTDDAKNIWLILQSMTNQRPYHIRQNVVFLLGKYGATKRQILTLCSASTLQLKKCQGGVGRDLVVNSLLRQNSTSRYMTVLKAKINLDDLKWYQVRLKSKVGTFSLPNATGGALVSMLWSNHLVSQDGISGIPLSKRNHLTKGQHPRTASSLTKAPL